MSAAAYESGCNRARYLKRLETRGIIGAAINPYKRPGYRAEWNKGFVATYYRKAHP